MTKLPPQTMPHRAARRAANALEGVTIVLPCLNEAHNVAQAVSDARVAAEKVAHRFEVVVVDDGSSDDTRAIVTRCIEADPRIRLIAHPFNLGYGAALRSGIRVAHMPWILLTDADLQFDLNVLEDFLSYAPEADLIIGWRILRADGLGRRANGAAWNWVVRRVFHLQVRDVGCAFKLVRRELAQRCDLTSSGPMINTELVVKCMAHGARLREVGVRHRQRSAGRRGRTAVGPTLPELLAVRRSLAEQRSDRTNTAAS